MSIFFGKYLPALSMKSEYRISKDGFEEEPVYSIYLAIVKLGFIHYLRLTSPITVIMYWSSRMVISELADDSSGNIILDDNPATRSSKLTLILNTAPRFNGEEGPLITMFSRALK